jgi:hypothetical protein
MDTSLGLKANSADVYTKTQIDTNIYTKTQMDTSLGTKANASDVYTKTQMDTSLGLKANSADVYTKTHIDGFSFLTSSSLTNYFNTATRTTTDANNYITFSGSGNTVSLAYDNLITALNGKQSTLSTSNLINANCLGTGIITNAMLNYLQDVTGNIGASLTSKANSTTPTLSGATLNNTTTLGASSTLSIPSTATVNFNSCTINGSGFLTTGSASSTYQTIISNTNRINATNIGTGVVDTTHLNYLQYVTANIGASLTSKAGTAGPTFTGTVNAATIVASGDITCNGTTVIGTEVTALKGLRIDYGAVTGQNTATTIHTIATYTAGYIRVIGYTTTR